MKFNCSPSATKVLNLLVAGLDESNRSKKIDNAAGSFMAVHVEFINHDETNEGDVFSVAHYYEQNGDLMRDPDVEFLQDNLGIYQEFFTYDATGKLQGVRTKTLRDCISFCTLWMRNIREQQRLF